MPTGLLSISARANRLFTISTEATGRAGVPFLNWKVTPTETALRIKGAGLYGIFFDGFLIYMGMFRGQTLNPSLGKVAEVRWWKHIQTITLRGNNVSITGRVRKIIEGGELHIDLANGLAAAEPIVYKHCGCVTSANRVRFASMHWDILRTDKCGQSLNRFAFLFVGVSSDVKDLSKAEVDELRHKLRQCEKRLIQKWSPICNTGKLDGSKVTLRQTRAEMQRVLHGRT